MNHKRKKSRTRTHGSETYPCSTPSYWNILYHSRPRRRRTANTLQKVLRGADADALIWDLGNSRPHKYFW